MSLPQTLSWDIFCTVIDNYGDIGVTWRLARQLASEHGQRVRLWVDDLRAFQCIQPRVDPTLDRQNLGGVEICRWTDPLPGFAPAQVVIEALACDLPDEFLARMARQDCKPVWINLEYLSAEPWVEGVHGLPSPHPPLEKYFFMPGYNSRTGGLAHEAWLPGQRQRFQANPGMQADFWRGIGLPPATPEELRISLFSYENRALAGLLSACADGPHKLRMVVPEGKPLGDISAWCGGKILQAGDQIERGQLSLHVLPMLAQDAYDRLLWASDFNFVRGEDSLVRAQFASRPLAWQVYLQEDEAHLAKLDAFLDIYCAAMPAALVDGSRAFFQAWNRQESLESLWPRLIAWLPDWSRHAKAWSEKLASQPDLASNLLIFCKKKLESRA